MITEFEEFVASVPPREGLFQPFAYYDHAGDCIEFFLSNEMYYGKWLDASTTIYIGERSDSIVGFQIALDKPA
jgi:hypothetical protein